MASMEGLFIYVNASMVLALLAVMFTVRRKNESVEKALQRLNKVIGFVFVTLVFPLCITSIILIWTDRSGEGNMFTYDGVMNMFRSKSEQWLLGIWIEILLFQIVTAFTILYDAITHLSQQCTYFVVAVFILDIFLPTFGILVYFAFRIAVLNIFGKKPAFAMDSKEEQIVQKV